MSLSTQPYKGARDFYPEDKRVQNYIFDTWRKAVRSFGYEEYDAPILEPIELYAAKSGEEIVTEQTYVFDDRGGRPVVIRPEMTPTVSRMVAARRQELPYPLRWFSIPNLWRYERPQRGRLREHWQLNVDIFGVSDISAEHELILVADSIMKAFGAKSSMYKIKVNSRVQMQSIFEQHGLAADQQYSTIKLIDKKDKLDPAKFTASLAKVLGEAKASEVLDSFQSAKANSEVQSLISLLNEAGISNVEYDPYLARGFDYYSDVVFEVFDTNPENSRSMFGGGRYDGLVGMFGVDPVPTVGFGMGDVTLLNFLQTHKLLPDLISETDVAVVLIGDTYPQAQKLFSQMRDEGLNISVDATDRKIDKKLKAIDKKGVRYVLFVGESELESGQYPLKDLVTGDEEKHSIERIISIIQDFRR